MVLWRGWHQQTGICMTKGSHSRGAAHQSLCKIACLQPVFPLRCRINGKSSRQVGSCACLPAFRVMGVMKHKYSCLSSLAVGSPYFCWHMVDGLELVVGSVVTQVCMCVWIHQCVWWKCVVFGHRYAVNLMTFLPVAQVSCLLCVLVC